MHDTDIHDEFRAFCDSLREQGHNNLQQHLKHLEVSEVPAEYRRSFSFWKSLSGPSRNFFLAVCHGRMLNKRFLREKGGRGSKAYRPFNTLRFKP
jgi:hypothetical protein